MAASVLHFKMLVLQEKGLHIVAAGNWGQSSMFWTLIVVAAIVIFAFLLGRRRALSSADGNIRALHSLPIYYGLFGALGALIPAAGVLVIWSVLQPLALNSYISSQVPDEAILEGSTRGLFMADVRRIADRARDKVHHSGLWCRSLLKREFGLQSGDSVHHEYG